LVHPLLDELAQRGKRERTDLDDAASCRLGDAIQEHRPRHARSGVMTKATGSCYSRLTAKLNARPDGGSSH
jgi:hypothetical protein